MDLQDKIEDGDVDHKLFVNGEVVNMEQFVKELDKLYGDNRFSEMMKKDKKGSDPDKNKQ